MTRRALLAYYRWIKRLYEKSMDMIGHNTAEPVIVFGNSGLPSPAESWGSTKASAVKPMPLGLAVK